MAIVVVVRAVPLQKMETKRDIRWLSAVAAHWRAESKSEVTPASEFDRATHDAAPEYHTANEVDKSAQINTLLPPFRGSLRFVVVTS